MRIKWILVLMLAVAGLMTLQACGRRIDPETSCNFVQNSSLQRVSWKEDVPIKIYVHKNFPQKYHQVIKEAAAAWNLKVGRELIVIEAFNISGHTQPGRDGYSILYWLNEWEPDRSSEQARTTIYWSGNRIYEADIRVNAKNFTFFSTEPESPFEVDMLSLLIHEFGHALGLSHNEALTSVMKASLASGTQSSRREVGPVDLTSLECEY